MVKQEKKMSAAKTFHSEQKAAFTLAEVLIALVILGVIAAVTIPSLMKMSTESSNRTKVKKAIASYEQVIENMKIASGKTKADELTAWAKGDDETCTNAKSFFKIKEDKGDCKFVTNDNVYWDISDLNEVVISIDTKNNCTSVVTDESNACYNKVFYLTLESSEDEKYFVINNPDGDACNTLKYAKIIESSTTCGSADTNQDYTKECVNPNGVDNWQNCTNCIACTIYSEFPWGRFDIEYDENGKFITQYENCENHITRENCEKYSDCRRCSDNTDCTCIDYYSCDEFIAATGRTNACVSESNK